MNISMYVSVELKTYLALDSLHGDSKDALSVKTKLQHTCTSALCVQHNHQNFVHKQLEQSDTRTLLGVYLKALSVSCINNSQYYGNLKVKSQAFRIIKS